jgi:hypothetical protein
VALLLVPLTAAGLATAANVKSTDLVKPQTFTIDQANEPNLSVTITDVRWIFQFDVKMFDVTVLPGGQIQRTDSDVSRLSNQGGMANLSVVSDRNDYIPPGGIPDFPPGAMPLPPVLIDEPTVFLDVLPTTKPSVTIGVLIASDANQGGDTSDVVVLQAFITPEPATLTLLGVGIAGVAGYRWRRKRAAAGPRPARPLSRS